MCVMSMVSQDWTGRNPQWVPQPAPTYPYAPQEQNPLPQPSNPFAPYNGGIFGPSGPTRAEFDALKKELEALKELLLAAKRYDEATGQRDCEEADKVKLFRALAKLVGVDMSDVFPEPTTSN